MQVYLVGGCVRDQLLGLPVKDKDWVVVGATPAQLLEQGYQQVGKDFPVFLHPQTKEEYALARIERKVGRGYTGFECDSSATVTLEEDLARRDLTVNALAQTIDGKLIDPYGGQDDLENRILRHVSPAFVEDPLRVLRVARFAARFASLGFRVADETQKLMKEIAESGELKMLVAERVWVELHKALSEDQPQVFFEVLHDNQALGELFPELEKLYGVPNPARWHPEIDSGIHTMMVLQQAAKLSKVIKVRLAALLHDVGKVETPKESWPSHPGHEARSVTLVQEFCQRYKVPKAYQELAVLVAKYHGQCHKIFELKPITVLKLLDQLDVWRKPERFKLFLLACEADSRGRAGFEETPYPQAQFLDDAYLAAKEISTQALLQQGLHGEALGKALNKQRLSKLTIFIKDYANKTL